MFAGSGFGLFARIAASGGVVRAIPAPGGASQPRSFFDKLNDWAKAEGAGGLGYIVFDAEGAERADRAQPGAGARRGDPRRLRPGPGDAVFFAAGKADMAPKFAGAVRTRLGEELGLICKKGAFRFCWITDFPMYELNEETGQDRFQPQPVQHAARRAGGAETRRTR